MTFLRQPTGASIICPLGQRWAWGSCVSAQESLQTQGLLFVDVLWLRACVLPHTLLSLLRCRVVFQRTHGLGAPAVGRVPDAPRQPGRAHPAPPVRLLPGAPGAGGRRPRWVAVSVCRALRACWPAVGRGGQQTGWRRKSKRRCYPETKGIFAPKDWVMPGLGEELPEQNHVASRLVGRHRTQTPSAAVTGHLTLHI